LRQPQRILPALAAGLLLTFALLGATDPRVRPHPVPASLYYPMCTDLLESAPAESTLAVNTNDGVVQPFRPAGNVAVCSLSVSVPNYSYGAITRIQSWDPVALAPDPTMIALRQTSAYVSDYSGWHGKESYMPPLVLQSLGNVAEAQRPTVAWSFENGASASYTFRWAGNADPNVPIGYHYVGNGPRVPLNGAHPVLSHSMCGGDQSLQSLYITQSVLRSDAMYGTDKSVVVQRFRVAQRTQLYWVELAFGSVTPANPGGYQPGTIAILDAQGQSQPPNNIGAALCSATLSHAWYVTSWDSHVDFDNSIELQPNHDYWLWVTTIWNYGLYVRNHAATESVPFNAGVGELWYLTGANPPWTADPAHSLDFKIVGLPLGVTSAPPPTRSLGTLRLRAGPNPAHGASMLAWSGARGALRFEVLDARGRRMASAGVDGAAGQWLFRGARDDGQPLPAGVYFVRATDGAGQAAVERVVLVR
jgi:hypothetical protein